MTPTLRTRTRTRDGYLIVGQSYMLPGQERVRRWCLLGAALGPPLFVASILYVTSRYGRPRGILGLRQATFVSWDAMPSDVRWLTLLAIAGWALCFFSMARLVLLQQTVVDQRLSDLGEEG